MVEKSYTIMSETALTLLKALKKLPSKEEPLSKAFKRDLVDTGMVDKKYLDVFLDLEKLRNSVREGKILDLPKQHIIIQREYVRKFIREAGRALKKKINIEK